MNLNSNLMKNNFGFFGKIWKFYISQYFINFYKISNFESFEKKLIGNRVLLFK